MYTYMNIELQKYFSTRAPAIHSTGARIIYKCKCEHTYKYI